jgi:hypothetical protein
MCNGAAMSRTNRRLELLGDELHEAAIRRVGWDDFGGSAYRGAMNALLAAFDADLQLTDYGMQQVYGLVLDVLSARLHANKGWHTAPGILSIPIHRPVIITGMPRTGTTALHRLLSVDPQFQCLEGWLLRTPMTRPPRDQWSMSPSYRAYSDSLEQLNARYPELRRIHEFSADEAEECTSLLMQNFTSCAWIAHHRLPSYARWFHSQSTEDSYSRYADILRLIGAREPHKRWLLKSPHHMSQLSALLRAFPDACIIQAHRDPVEAIPSFCSLLYAFGRDVEEEAATPRARGPYQCAHWKHSLDLMQAVRRQSPEQVFDVDYRDLSATPLRTIRSIYEYFDLCLNSQVEQQISTQTAISPAAKHGAHRYTIDEWGISATEIRDMFADYRQEHRFS